MAVPQIIPLRSVPSQVLSVQLGGQPTTFRIYARTINVPVTPAGGIVTDPPVYETVNPVFLDLYLNGALVVGGVLCLKDVGIVRDAYLGFVGELAFSSIMADNDPVWTGLGWQYLLLWWPSALLGR